jgi:hypothetical protein
VKRRNQRQVAHPDAPSGVEAEADDQREPAGDDPGPGPQRAVAELEGERDAGEPGSQPAVGEEHAGVGDDETELTSVIAS